ncbi:MAG TPA: DUF167 domain-containing protein [Nitrospirota bacterium]|nr:DUF167 domain-containing protein [Nitrospirota bacterium]
MSEKAGKKRSEQAVLSLRVQPRASRNGIVRMESGGFKVRLTAPAVENAANEALVKFLSEKLDVPRSAVVIVSGQSSREKRVRIEGISEDTARMLLMDAAE